MMRVLAIESTCDETAAAIVVGTDTGIIVKKNIVASSADIHAKYGGVVPEVAAREQIMSIVPVLRECNINKNEVDAIAVSYGPGLIGSLLIGIETAKTLAYAWKKPLIGVNHMVAHVAANWISSLPELPALALIVSGGHTDIILIRSLTDWQWVGGTRDDAVGEAFDKAARILGLPYPGGPNIQKAVEEIKNKERNISRVRLPRPMIHVDTLEMSFSGLKSALIFSLFK